MILNLFDAFIFSLYRFFLFPIALQLLKLAKPFLSKKIQLLIEERAEEKWMSLPTRPIWIHAASGEIEYAKSLIRLLKEEFPQIPILVTYFSPSAKKLVQGFEGIDLSLPLVWDQRQSVARFLNFYQPRLCLFARTDVWPELAHQVQARNIPSALFSCTFSEESADRNFLSTALFRGALNKLKQIFCVAEADLNNLRSVGVTAPIQVHGDTRYDQVLFRVQNPNPLRFAFNKESHQVFVCGSTWPQDEEILIEGLSDFLKAPGSKVIFAPHELHEDHLQSLERSFAKNSWRSQRYSKSLEFTEQILLVDEIGRLQELYLWGHCAFVGGSFKDKVHSVMEPLAAGCPVVLGPHHTNNREALHFQHKRIHQDLFVVSLIDNALDLKRWLSKPQLFSAQNDLQAFVLKMGGSTKKLKEWIRETLGLF